MLPEISKTHWFSGPSNRTLFIGRASELAQLDKLMQVPKTLLTVYGTPGMGKTSLCAHWAEQTDLPILFFSADTTNSPQTLWQALGEALELHQNDESAPPEQTQASLLSVLNHRDPMVLWFDGTSPEGASLDVLLRWLRKAPQHRILITGLRRLQIPGEKGIELGGLAQQEALSLFETCAQEVATSFELTEHNTPQVIQIIERLEGNPLAIEIVASQLLLYNLERLGERLEDSLLDMQSVWRAENSPQRSLRAALMPVWKELDETAHLIMYAISFWQMGTTFSDLERVLELETADIFRAALKLRSRALLERVQTPHGEWFKLNSIVRELAQEQSKKNILTHGKTHQQLETACIKCMLLNAQTAIEQANCARDVPTRAYLNVCLRALRPYFEHPILGLNVLLVTQKAQRLVGTMAPRNEAMYQALLRHDDAKTDSALALNVRLEILWLEKQRGILNIKQLQALFEEALAINDVHLCGEVIQIKADSELRNGDTKMAVEQTRLAITYFEQTSDAASIAFTRYLIVSFQLNLIGAGNEVDLDVFKQEMEDQRKASVGLGAFYQEIYECNVASFAFFSGDHQRALEMARQGIERSTKSCEPLIPLRWTQYYHNWLSRSGAETDHLIEIGQNLIERCIQQAFPIGPTLVVQAMSLQAIGRIDECDLLLNRYAKALETETIARVVDGTLSTLHATNALIRGDTTLAHHHLDLGQETFAQHALPVNLLVIFMLRSVAHILDLEMAAAHTCLEEADRLIQSMSPAYRQARAEVLDLCNVLQTRNPSVIEAFLKQLKYKDSRIVQIFEALTRGVLVQLSTQQASSQIDFHMAIDGTWFEQIDQQRVDISKRLALTRVLCALINLYKSSPGTGLSMYELIEIGWPDESLDLDSGTNRVRATIYALRSLGLRDVLINDQGYLLDSQKVIVTR